MKFLNIFIILFLIINYNAIAQLVIINGKVIDNNRRNQLSGVTVKVGNIAAKTGEDGQFEIKAQLRSLIESGIYFNSIGYLSSHFIYEPNHFYEIELVENIIQLKEVLIGNGREIIKKAIRKIPDNYPDKPFVIGGIMRIQTWRNKSEYFKADAVIKAYIPSYSSHEKTSISVEQNKIDTLYDKSIDYLRQTSNYNIVDFQDIVRNKYNLNKIYKKKIDYWLIGKQKYNGHEVFVINTTLIDTIKTLEKVDATFYIDVASYAFVAANIKTYNLVRQNLLTLNALRYTVEYEKIGTKWYLKETHTISKADLNIQSPQTTIDFIRTKIDSLNVEKIPYKNIVQGKDNILLIDKPANNEFWIPFDKLFKKGEDDGKIEVFSNLLLDTIRKNNAFNNLSNQNRKRKFKEIVLDYANNDNVRNILGVKEMPVILNNDLKDISRIINYGITYSVRYRLFKNLFLGLDANRNLWNKKKINSSSFGINIVYELIFNKYSRNITIIPYAGIERFGLNYDRAKFNKYIINTGLNITYELTHKSAIVFSTGLNSSKFDVNLNSLNITSNKYKLGLGFLFKR